MKSQEIRDKLITAGVKNLNDFGYPECNSTNILTDEIYSAFFDNMLRDNLGHSRSIDAEIIALRKQIEEV